MGVVTSALLDLVRAHLDRGVVLWLDPERQYGDVLPHLHAAGISVEAYDGSIFALRRRAEPSLAADTPGRLVVYVPLGEDETRYTLAELHAAAVVLRPGSPAANRNTRLAIVARHVLAGKLPEQELESVLEKVDAGTFRLADLDDVAERPGSAIDGALRLVYHENTPTDVLLAFISDPSRDEELSKKKAVHAVALLASTLGFSGNALGSIVELRAELARHVLAVELAAHCPDDVMPYLPRPAETAHRDACVNLARTWRRRSDLRETYVEASRSAAGALHVTPAGLAFERLERLHTFDIFEAALQGECERRLRGGATAEVLAIAEKRARDFWASVDGVVMSRWTLIATAARLFVVARGVEQEFEGTTSADAIALAYTRGENPWCELDALHRRLERFVHLFDFAADGRHSDLWQLVATARERHRQVASRITERFTDSLVREGLRVTSIPPQVEGYERLVKPALADGKVAYVLVDALRYEMARELADALARSASVRLQSLLGTLPSITEIGMAALMPRAHVAPALATVSDGKLALSVEGNLLRTRQERLGYLSQRADVPVYTTTLDSLLSGKPKLRKEMSDATLIVVTATEELDGLCEAGNVSMARRLMDDVLSQLVRATTALHGLGFKTVVITSDHGFLFGESVETGGRIDPPGGQTVDLHRRAWIGRGGAASPSYARFTSRQLGLAGDLEVAVPRGLGCFKAPGATLAYFHGGASPQELLIPGLVVRASPEFPHRGTVEWVLTPGSKALSSRFLSLEVSGSAVGLFKLSNTAVRAEVRDGKKRLSRAVAASYGFEEATGSAAMEPEEEGRTFRRNTITLEIQSKPSGSTVSIVLVDPATDRVLKSLDDMPVRMAGF